MRGLAAIRGYKAARLSVTRPLPEGRDDEKEIEVYDLEYKD